MIVLRDAIAPASIPDPHQSHGRPHLCLVLQEKPLAVVSGLARGAHPGSPGPSLLPPSTPGHPICPCPRPASPSLYHRVARTATILLLHDVIANGVHIGPQTLGLKDGPFSQVHKESGKSLLARVLDCFPRRQSRTQFDLDQGTEIRDEMLLGAGVSCAQTCDISLVKGVELQDPTLGTERWQTV